MDIVTYVLCKNSSKQYTDEQIAKFPKYLNNKGAVDYYKDLPTNAELGDLYTVRYNGSEGTERSGASYTWSGEDWVQISIDASEKQDTLITGQNIKSVNGNSLLGEGNLELNAADVHALPDTTPIPSIEGLASERWVQNQGYLKSNDIANLASKDDLSDEAKVRNTVDEMISEGLAAEIKNREDEYLKVDGHLGQLDESVFNLQENKIDDVKVKGKSVVVDRVAEIDFSATIDKTFTSNVTVGHLEAGTPFTGDETLADILYKILYKKPIGEIVNIYTGVLHDLPEDVKDLEVEEMYVSELLEGKNIVLPRALDAYRIIGCGKDLQLKKWLDPQTGWDLPYGSIELEQYNLYYINEPDPSTGDDGRLYDEESATYKFIFEEA